MSSSKMTISADDGKQGMTAAEFVSVAQRMAALPAYPNVGVKVTAGMKGQIKTVTIQFGSS